MGVATRQQATPREFRMPILARGLIALLVMAAGTGCAGRVDRFVVDRVLVRAATTPDVSKACETGSAAAHLIAAASSEEHPPRRAMVVAEVTAALCEEAHVREAELDGIRARVNLTGPGRAGEVQDARLREERARRSTAARLFRAWGPLESLYGPVGGDACPRVPAKDEIVVLLGLYAGMYALLHDRASGGGLGVPADILGSVARAADCIDDERWWYAPSALQAGAWVTVPGSAPEGIDPWQKLEEAAHAGEGTGVRLARALAILAASNSGRDDIVRSGIRAHAGSLKETPMDSTWALLDRYSFDVSEHISDVLWMEAEGHRTPRFGDFPLDEDAAPQSGPFGSDPFGSDPFGSDPFGNDPLFQATEPAEETP